MWSRGHCCPSIDRKCTRYQYPWTHRCTSKHYKVYQGLNEARSQTILGIPSRAFWVNDWSKWVLLVRVKQNVLFSLGPDVIFHPTTPPLATIPGPCYAHITYSRHVVTTKILPLSWIIFFPYLFIRVDPILICRLSLLVSESESLDQVQVTQSKSELLSPIRQCLRCWRVFGTPDIYILHTNSLLSLSPPISNKRKGVDKRKGGSTGSMTLPLLRLFSCSSQYT